MVGWLRREARRAGTCGRAAIGLAAWAALASTAAAQDDGSGAPPTPVAVATITYVDEAIVSEAFAGVAAARRDSRLGFERGGLIAEVRADVGDRVAAGEELARLDLRTLDAQIAAAEAAIAEADAALGLARTTAARQRELVERGDASRQRVDEADANVAVSAARLEAARAQRDQLGVVRDLSILTAPYAGVVTERHVDEGSVVGPGAAVLDVSETEAVEIRIGLPIDRARTLEAGRAYPFRVDGRAAQARLRATTGVVDPATQTVTAVFDVVAGDITIGEVARLSLPARVEQAGFWAPITALAQGRRGLWTVLALEPEANTDDVYRLVMRVVDVVHTESDRVFVRGAARDGEMIVAAGVERVVPGQRVAPFAARVARSVE